MDPRIFAGLSVDETAGTLGISPAQVKRDWQAAIAWLREHWSEHGAHDELP